MRVTRDQIIGAANRIAVGRSRALCSAFAAEFERGIFGTPLLNAYFEVPKFLRSLGGRARNIDWYWPDSKKGCDQRLVFLAFMLVWYDDIVKGK